jgi:AcrR family transcriptional regulator
LRLSAEFGALAPERKMEKKNRKEEQRSASVDGILVSALELFVKNGYRSTTVEMIAERAGLTKGAVYFYFDSKAAVMLRLLDDAERIVVDPAEAGTRRAGQPALDKLIAFLHRQAQVALEHPQHLLLLILMSVEFYGTNTESEVRVRAIYRRLYGCVESVIHQGQSEGTIRTDIRSHELTSLVMAQHDGILIEWYRRPGEFDGKSLARAVRLAMVDAVRAREGAEKTSSASRTEYARGA